MDNKKGLLLILATALISGVSIFLNKFGVAGIDSSLFTGAKNIVVAIFLFSLILIAKDWKKIKALKAKDYGLLALIGLVGGSIPFLLFFKGLQLTTAAQGSFIHKTMFVWVGILALIFLKEKLDKGIAIGAVLLLAGNLLILKLNHFAFASGDLLVLGATLLWGVETIISKHALKAMDSKVVAFGRMFFGSLIIIAYLAATKKLSLAAALTSSQLLWILITSVFLLGYVFTWYSGLKHVKATVATSILLLGSVVTTILDLAFSGLTMTAQQVIGMVLLILGVTSAVGFTAIINMAKNALKKIHSISS